MSLIVQKYGGTSVGSTERIHNVAKRILETQRAGNQVVAVVSAMAGVTNKLIEMANEVSADNEPTEREMDVLLSTGEQTTIALTSMAINALGGKAISLTGAQAGIVTDGEHTRARISNISPDEVHRLLDEDHIVILAGFQGSSPDGRITTLGRGGSDLTAIAMAAAIDADLCQILTDVDGVYTCDPRVVKNAKKINEISYDEMLEMASSGSKVMQSRSVEFAKKFGVKFEVKSSLNNNPGTIVTEEHPNMESVVVRGISIEKEQAKVTIENVSDEPGVAAKIFQAISESGVIIDMIVQNVSKTNHTDISFTLHRSDLKKAKQTIEAILNELSDTAAMETTDGIGKLSVVGIGMRSHSGVAAQMFEALANGSINIQMISTSEIKTAVIIQEEDLEKAANIVHEAFNL
ncbi:MAG: aspartate kinase [Verrucomicrobiota bacterium]|nr:aspartate kinase [Verrucomicrobiota bacterium]